MKKKFSNEAKINIAAAVAIFILYLLTNDGGKYVDYDFEPCEEDIHTEYVAQN